MLLCLGKVTLLLAQEGTIKGRVHNGSEDLPFATVSLGNKTMLTGKDGAFSFSVKAGSYRLLITHTGYKSIEKVIKKDVGNTKEVDIT